MLRRHVALRHLRGRRAAAHLASSPGLRCTSPPAHLPALTTSYTPLHVTTDALPTGLRGRPLGGQPPFRQIRPASAGLSPKKARPLQATAWPTPCSIFSSMERVVFLSFSLERENTAQPPLGSLQILSRPKADCPPLLGRPPLVPGPAPRSRAPRATSPLWQPAQKRGQQLAPVCRRGGGAEDLGCSPSLVPGGRGLIPLPGQGPPPHTFMHSGGVCRSCTRGFSALTLIKVVRRGNCPLPPRVLLPITSGMQTPTMCAAAGRQGAQGAPPQPKYPGPPGQPAPGDEVLPFLGRRLSPLQAERGPRKLAQPDPRPWWGLQSSRVRGASGRFRLHLQVGGGEAETSGHVPPARPRSRSLFPTPAQTAWALPPARPWDHGAPYRARPLRVHVCLCPKCVRGYVRARLSVR